MVEKESPATKLVATVYQDAMKVSGEEQEFGTGAIRDTQIGKGRYDLIPPVGVRRLARRYELGANRYGDRNWEHGMPISRLLDSALRHINQYLEGDASEDHLAAVAWNIFGAMHMEEKVPEMQNVRTRPDYKEGTHD